MANWQADGFDIGVGSHINFNVKKGTKVRCEINTGETWEGILYFNQPHLIALNHAFEVTEKRSRPGLKYIFKNEFYTFDVVPDPNNPDPESSDEEIEEDIAKFSDFKYQIDNMDKFVIFSKHNCDKIKRTLKRIMVKRITIGVYGIDLNDTENSPLGLIALSTKNIVYIFDIRTLGDKLFEAGVRYILESKGIIKIGHNLEKLCIKLMEYHNVTLTNFFDIAVFESYLESKESTDNEPLYNTLNKRISVPLHMAILTRNNLTITMGNSKMDENLMYLIIFSLLFLIPIRNFFLKIKNKNLYTYIDKYSERSRAKSPITALFVTRQDIFEELEKLKISE